MSENESEETPVLSRVDRGVAVISFNRPRRLNAWTPALGERYAALLDTAAGDPDVRAIVVTGEGRGFSSGADTDAIAENSRRTESGLPPVDADPWRALEIPKPVIAAINGPCVGLGFVFAAMCDVRFAAQGAKLAAPFSRLGLVAEDGLSWLLPRIVGVANALDLLLSGRTVLAEDAAAMGFVNRVHPPEALLGATIDYAVEIAERCSPRALAQIKAQLYRHLETDLAAAIADSAALTRAALASEDVREGMASLAERRLPRFASFPDPPVV